MRLTAICIALACAVGATGCATTDSVLFVTSTEVGIGADAQPGHVNIGYDRIEGFVGPAYENGAIPPVVGSIQSNLEVFTPKIKQLYATGNAAVLATAASGGPPARKPLSGKRRLMFFGTSTNIGLKLSFTGQVPDSINFGYKRKEISFIPLAEKDPTDGAEDHYGSVLASIDMDLTDSAAPASTALAISQFVATGEAAENLAVDGEVRANFTSTMQEAVRRGAQDAVVLRQRIGSVNACVNPNNGPFDPGVRTALANVVNKAVTDRGLAQDQAAIIKSSTSTEELDLNLKGLQGSTPRLIATIDANPELCQQRA